MNKTFKITGVITVFLALILFAGVTAAFAQGPHQADGITPPGINQTQTEAGVGLGVMAVDEAAMHAAIAETLGMDFEDFEAAVAAGKTSLLLAQEQGVDFADVQAAMDAAHNAALGQAVNDGLMTQEQANWILSHRGGQNSQGAVLSDDPINGPAGRMGRGPGGNGDQTGDCSYLTP